MGARLVQGAWGRLDVAAVYRDGFQVGIRIDQADPDIRVTPEVMQSLMLGSPWADAVAEPDGALLLILAGINRSVVYRMRWIQAYEMWHGHQA